MLKGKRFLSLLMVAIMLAGCGLAMPATGKAVGNEPVPSKFDPPVTYTVGRILDSDTVFLGDDDLEHNVWADLYRDELGIILEYAWTTLEDAYEQKIALSVAANDIPDMLRLPLKSFKMFMDGDLCEDLTDAFDTYASGVVRQFAEDDPMTMAMATVDGKLLALPQLGAEVATDNGQVLYTRKDWLDALGLSAPQTLEEVLAVADAFAHQDPDGNGENDTIGFGMAKEIYDTGLIDAIGFFAGNNAYIDTWLDDGEGGLKYSSLEPAVKESLMMLHEMYKNGVIDPEFIVKDRWKAGEDLTAGKIGIWYGCQWSMIFATQATMADADIQWEVTRLPTHEAGVPAKLAAKSPAMNKTYYVVRKGVAHPEGLIKMANAAADFKAFFGSRTSVEEDKKYGADIIDGERVQFFKYMFVDVGPSNNTFKQFDVINAAYDDPSVTDIPKVLEQVKTIHMWTDDGNIDGLMEYNFQYGPNSMYGMLKTYAEDSLFFFDLFQGLPTETMVDASSSLKTRQLELWTKIIIEGNESLFDDYVDEWLATGGRDITEEVNKWWAENK